MRKIWVLFVLTLTLSLVVSMNGTSSGSSKPAEATKNNAEVKPPQEDNSLSGKVVETLNSGGYTYVNIEKNGKKIWVAVPEMKISVGKNIAFQPGSPMSNFTSKTLNRTFDTIVFSSGVIGENTAGSSTQPAAPKKAEVPANKAIKVSKASGPNAYTVAELYENAAKLDKKEVVVRGQVVKVSPEIMGKNWIHLQDGSGDAAKGTNDILVTSQQDLPAVGDTVTAKGTLFKDKDFGSGYKYAVIVEQASVKK